VPSERVVTVLICPLALSNILTSQEPVFQNLYECSISSIFFVLICIWKCIKTAIFVPTIIYPAPCYMDSGQIGFFSFGGVCFEDGRVDDIPLR
jgi:hypothetical protein